MSSQAQLKADPSELTIAQSVFEGLFSRALTLTPEFREDLRLIGYDVTRQEPTYHPDVWNAALHVAIKHVHPNLPSDQALRKLGTTFIDGFFQTIAGRFVATALPIVGPDGVMKRLARFWGSGAPGTLVETQPRAPGEWAIKVTHPYPQTDFDVGMFEGGFKRTGVKASVDIVERRPNGYTALVRWTAAQR